MRSTEACRSPWPRLALTVRVAPSAAVLPDDPQPCRKPCVMGSSPLTAGGLGVLGRPPLLEPFLIVLDGMDRQVAEHAGMTESAQLSAGNFVPTCARGLKPGWDLSARHGILFQ